MTFIALETQSSGILVAPEKAPSRAAAAERSTVERAKLVLYPPPGQALINKQAPQAAEIEFQFNPKQVSITKTASWQPATSKRPSAAEFKSLGACTMTLEMFLDATGTRDAGVVKAVEKLFACCSPTSESMEGENPSPPLVVLKWGPVSSFQAYITSVSAVYSLFSPEGMPIRATCTLSLTEMPGGLPGQNPTSGSDAVRRVHRMVAGDTLASVAYGEYGDPARWRSLAAWNGVDDPMRVPVGAVLLLPTLRELGR